MSSLGFQPTATCDIWGRGSLFYTLILYIYIYIYIYMHALLYLIIIILYLIRLSH